MVCFGPGPDEAFYWEWSRHIDLGYVEHPPLVAYSIWIMRMLLGEGAWAWRLVAVAASAGMAWFLFCTGRVLFSSRVGMWAAVVLTCSPAPSLAGALILPETLLAFFICLALYLSARLITSGNLNWFYALGLVLGGALLSKIPGILIPAALGLFAILSPAHRRWFRVAPPYVMVLIGVALFSPVIYWNATHAWQGIAFIGERTEIKEAVVEPGLGLMWQSCVGQAAYHSPGTFVLLWVGMLGMGYRGLVRRDPRALLLFCYTGPVMMLFMVVASTRFTLPHWPMAGYLGAYVAIPAFLLHTPQPIRWRCTALRVAVFLGLAICVVAPIIMIYPVTTVMYRRVQPIVGGPPRVIEPMAHAVGWSTEIRDGIIAVSGAIEENTGQRPVVMTHFHMLAGILAYGLRDYAPVICLHGQAHQYDLWYTDDDVRGRPVLFVSADAFLTSAGRAGRPLEYYKFETCTPLPGIEVVRRGVRINVVHMWSCSGYAGPADVPGPRI